MSANSATGAVLENDAATPSSGTVGETTTAAGTATTDENHWNIILLSRVQQRNREQTEPFTAIYASNTKLWYEHARLRSLLTDSKHQLSLIQHEVTELGATAKPAVAVDKLDAVKGKLSQLQQDLRERGGIDDSERKIRYDLTKRVRDQEKLLANQVEELKVVKQELSSAHHTISQLATELTTEKKSSQAVFAELESLRTLRTTLENENAQLISRILAEKAKTAEEMNEQIHKGEANQSYITTTPPTSSTKRLISRSSSGGEVPVVETFTPPSTLSIHQCHVGSVVNDVIATANGQIYCTAGADGTVKVVESSSGRIIRSLAGSSAFICVDISEGTLDTPSSSSSSSSSSSAKTKNVEDGPCGQAGDDTGTGSRINKYQYLLAGGGDGTSRLWDLSTGTQLRQLQGHANKVHACHLFAGRTRAATGSADRTIKFWDIQHSGHAVSTIRTSSSVLSICPTVDQNALVSGHQDGSVRVWDVATGGSVLVLEKLHASHVTCVACSPNGYHLLTASKDNTLGLVDMRRYEKVLTMKSSSSSFRIVCDWSRASFSPCGRYVAAGGGDGTVVVWSVATGGVTTVLSLPTAASSQSNQPVGSVASNAITGVFWSRQSSGGGIFAATKSGEVCMWR